MPTLKVTLYCYRKTDSDTQPRLSAYCPKDKCTVNVEDDCQACTWYAGHNNLELECGFPEEPKEE